MAKELFGTDGIRGTPGEFPLDGPTLYALGRALGDSLDSSGPRSVLIGMDTRESGPPIARRIAQGLAAAGATPVFAGVITTPGAAWLTCAKGFAAGIVISASHNPFHDNGVKLIASSGMKFPDEFEERLEEKLESQPVAATPAMELSIVPQPELAREYLAELQKHTISGARLAGMKIVLDCANGAASRLGPELFRSLGANAIAIHNAPNGRNINARCGSLHPESLQKKVVEVGATLGVAFDGDADRAIFSSASGQIVNGDSVLLITARYLKSTSDS